MTSLPCSAGGVIVEPTGQIALACQQGRSWSLPKGHVEAGESALDAARREIREECGIDQLVLIDELGSYRRSALGADGLERPGNDKIIRLFLFTTSQRTLAPSDPDNPAAIWADILSAERLLTHPRDADFLHQMTDRITAGTADPALPDSPAVPRHTAVILAAQAETVLGQLDALDAAGIRSFVVIMDAARARLAAAMTRLRPDLAIRFVTSQRQSGADSAAALRAAMAVTDPCDVVLALPGSVACDERLPAWLLSQAASATAVDLTAAASADGQHAADLSGVVSGASAHASSAAALCAAASRGLSLFRHADLRRVVTPALEDLAARAPSAGLSDLVCECLARDLRMQVADVSGLVMRNPRSASRSAAVKQAMFSPRQIPDEQEG
jgi:8-oxo-dGTP pyrophosphatase MutT (NUDIX family)